MARIEGAKANQGGLLRRLFVSVVYSLTKRKVGRVVMPVQVTAHHPKILWGYGQMEQALLSSKLVSEPLKGLAQLRVATLIGCRFESTSALPSADKVGFRQTRLRTFTTTAVPRISQNWRNSSWNIRTV